MNTQRFCYRVALFVLVRLMLGEPLLFAGGPAYERLRKEAFLRGGDAIAAALTVRNDTELTARMAVNKPIPPPLPRPAMEPQAPADRGMSKLLWTGLIAGFAASGVLVYHFATGPGASVRNCSTCK
jgi:hypothetical protein